MNAIHPIPIVYEIVRCEKNDQRKSCIMKQYQQTKSSDVHSEDSLSTPEGKSNSAKQASIDGQTTGGLLSIEEERSAIDYNNKHHDAAVLSHFNSVCSNDAFSSIAQADGPFVQNVALFQQQHVLVVDGKIGPKTYAVICSIAPPQSEEGTDVEVEIWFIEEGLHMLSWLLDNSKLRNSAEINIDSNESDPYAGKKTRQENRKRDDVLLSGSRISEEDYGYILDYQQIFGLTVDGILDQKLKSHIEIMYEKMVDEGGYTRQQLANDEYDGQKAAEAERDFLIGQEDLLISAANQYHAHNIPECKAFLASKNSKVIRDGAFTKLDVSVLMDEQVKLQIPVTGVPDNDTMVFIRQLTAKDIADPSGNIEGDSANDELKVAEYKKKRVAGTLFVNGISVTDVGQGALGDCWYLAALASVARTDEQAIRNMFEEHEDGTFTVKLYAPIASGGARSSYRLDTDIWVDEDNDPAFAQYGDRDPDDLVGYGRELWVMLAEKALAMHAPQYEKNHSQNPSFKDIEGGLAEVGLEIITGKVSTTHQITGSSSEDQERVWSIITKAIQDNQDIVGSTATKEPVPPSVPTALFFTTDGVPKISEHLSKWSNIWYKPANIPAAQAEYLRVVHEEYQILDSSYAPDWVKDDYRSRLQDFENQLPVFFESKQDDVVAGHAWTIVDAFTAGEQRYVKIFNPWRKTKSSTAAVNDGTFVVTLQEFTQRYYNFSTN